MPHIPDPTPPEPDKKPTDLLLDKAEKSFKWWNNLATLNKNDSMALSLFKIFVRIVGVIVMIALSPFALLGLIVAFLAVM